MITDHRIDFDTKYAKFNTSITTQIDNEYDLLILDWMLDVPNAKGVIDMVQQCSPDTQILALTSEAPTTDPINRGADEFLVEPISDQMLYETIERLALQKDYKQSMNEFFRLATERALLQTELESEIDVTDRYSAVVQDMETCQKHTAAVRSAFSDKQFDCALRQLLDD